jgi:hypothetical protein
LDFSNAELNEGGYMLSKKVAASWESMIAIGAAQ